MNEQLPDREQKGEGVRHRGVGRWASAWLEATYQFAIGLSFLQLSLLIIGLALVVALGLSVHFWDWFYGVRGAPVAVVTLLVAFLTATPLTAFMVYVIRKAEEARAELAESNRALQKARDQAEVASRAKTQFLANVSHELRTPLNAVIGFSDLLRTESLGPLGDEKYREYAEDVHNSGVYLLELIEDLLDISRIEADAYVLQEETTELSRIVDAVVRLLLNKAQQEGIEIRNRISPSEVPPLYADARTIKQMLLHLVSNGIKFTPRGGSVALSSRIEQDGWLIVAVEDTGPGIAPENIERALTPFSRIDDAMTREREGVGLGLSLTKSLIEMHGGELTIASAQEGGTVAELRFPPPRVRPGARVDRSSDA